MARHKDVNWQLPEGEKKADGSTTHLWESIQTAVLMDIRDELRILNALLRCPNFQKIPFDLRRIRLNTTKRKKKK